MEDSFDIKRGVGDKILMEVGSKLGVKLPEVVTSLESVFIGLYKDEYLIISTPQPYSNTIGDKLFKGRELIITYISFGKVFQFQSKIIDYIVKPVRLLIISFPEAVKEQELRSVTRRNCGIPAKIIFSDGEYCGAIQDITTIGCSLLCNFKKSQKKIKTGLRVTLQCNFPETSNTSNVHGVIKNTRKKYDQIIVGVKFDKYDENAQNELMQYIFKLDSFLKGDLIS